ncbi:PAS domain-containing protein [Methylobacterium sp. NEAU 140]|uniref:PAS domain-containing protein n=1 Tax=Methylobacterium sp. NEAU 140 TaxID=3064945 RepID=UPI0027326958|nr:PAS domain-containing protein [Methylobacterium sp. NEAU 140]MDP4022847.1 PAS domain-containing protein [Methylobacterium sp. NEAU 140]
MTGLVSTVPPGLLAAGFIGTWDTDVAAGRSVLDAGAAALLAGNADLAGQPIPMEVALGRTHPDDRGWVFERIRRARSTGGPFSAEFRILTETGGIRWILNRGSLTPDADGRMRGRGAYIDTTDSHPDLFMPAAGITVPEADPLIAAADRSLEAHAAIARSGREDLRELSELLLAGIGRTLAQRWRG